MDVSPDGHSPGEPLLPLVVFPHGRRSSLASSASERRRIIRRYLPRVGAILFRGFPVFEDHHFERFVAEAALREPPVGPPRVARVWAWCALPERGRQLTLTDRRCRTELCLEACDVLLLDPAIIAHATLPGAAGILVRREVGA